MKNNTGEVYETKNIIIKKLSNRFIYKIEQLLINNDTANKKGIDIGSAEGHLINNLKSKKLLNNIYMTEIDYDKITNRVTDKSELQYIQCDATNISFKSNTFDFVIATEILEHLQKPEKALQEICRISKKDAAIILSVPYEPYFQLGNLLRGKHLALGGKTPEHLHFWTRKEFNKLLNNYLIIKNEYRLATFPWLMYLCTNK